MLVLLYCLDFCINKFDLIYGVRIHSDSHSRVKKVVYEHFREVAGISIQWTIPGLGSYCVDLCTCIVLYECLKHVCVCVVCLSVFGQINCSFCTVICCY